MIKRIGGSERSIERRALLQLAAATGGAAALARFGAISALAADAEISVANPRYNQIYKVTSNYYINDPQWVSVTKPRITWPAAGERVPELAILIPTVQKTWLDAFRKWASDGEKLGLKYNIEQVSEARWLDTIQAHKHGDIEMHPSILRPERVDPSEWLVSRAYGLDRRNYGEWTNEQYDALIDAQAKESDPVKRLKLVQDAQRVLAEDLLHHSVRLGPGGHRGL
jgi:peptide/nickel transport system substrate-binding protein